MTLDELRAKHATAYKIIKGDHAFWQRVVDRGEPKALEKVQECDQLLAILTEMKDALKKLLPATVEQPTYDQPTLLDVPKATKYP